MATKPRFLIGDTAWMLWKAPNADIDTYLTTRKAQGFDYVQINLLFDVGQGVSQNRDGIYPTTGDSATPWPDTASARFQEPYMTVIDYIVIKANSLGLYVWMTHMWGGDFFTLVTSSTIAAAFGQWIGNRYKDKKVVHLGLGEYHESGTLTSPQLALINSYLDGLESAAPNQLKTMHPDGSRSSSDFAFNNLDFNGVQEYQVQSSSATDIATDWALAPIKPCGELEPAYEASTREGGTATVDNYYVMYEGWHGILQGGAYHTYGHSDVWQWINSPLTKLTAAGALCVPKFKALMESRFLGGIPTQGLITSPGTYQGSTGATDTLPGTLWRGLLRPDASGAIIYAPKDPAAKTINLNLLAGAGPTINAWWIDPETLISYDQNNVETNSPARVLTSKVATAFTTPSSTKGWLLCLDDAALNLIKPGSAYAL